MAQLHHRAGNVRERASPGPERGVLAPARGRRVWPCGDFDGARISIFSHATPDALAEYTAHRHALVCSPTD